MALKTIARSLGGGLVIALLAVACGGSSTKTPGVSLSPCTLSRGVSAVCGSVRVLEDRNADGGRQISLRIAVLKAQSGDLKQDPIFYLAGYGSGAVDMAWLAAQELRPANQNRDIVLVDQRGTGASNALNCPTPSIEEQRRMASDEVAFTAFVSSCLKSLDADPALYTTPVAMDDLDQVRQSLGYEQINLYGVSYGVSSGLAYMQRYGAHVRSAIFDSGSLLDYHLWEMSAPHAQQALDQLFDRCAADRSCEDAFPSLREKFAAIQATLGKGAKLLTFVDPRASAGGATTSLAFNYGMFAWIVENLDAFTATAVLLPRLIQQAYDGDYVPIAKQYLLFGAQPLSTNVQTWVIACSDDWAQMDVARITATGQGSYFLENTLETARSQARMCGVFPKAVGSSGKVSTQAPVLFLNGTADPADPPENVATAKETMPNSLSVAIQGAGHGIIDLGCISEMAAAFYAVASVKDLPQSCALNIVLPPFDLG